MAEHPKFTSKTEGVLRKAKLTLIAGTLVNGMEAMLRSAEKCDILRLLYLVGEMERLYGTFLNEMDAAIAQGKVSFEEGLLAADEISRIRDDYIEATIRRLEKECGCRWRSERS